MFALNCPTASVLPRSSAALDLATGPVLPGEIRPPAAPKTDGPLPELPRFLFSAPVFAVYVWRGIAAGWCQCSYAPRDRDGAARLAASMGRIFPQYRYKVVAV